MTAPIDGQRRTETPHNDTETEATAAQASASKRSQDAKPKTETAPPPAGTKTLVDGHAKRLIPSPIYRMEPKSEPKAPPGADPNARVQISGQDFWLLPPGSPMPAAPPAAKPAPPPKREAYAGLAPPRVRAEAQRRYEALSDEHKKACAELDKAIGAWDREVSELKKIQQSRGECSQVGIELDDAIAHAEYQAARARQLKIELKNAFNDATHQLALLAGEKRPVAIGQGRPIDPNAPKPMTPAEEFQAKLDRYNTSMENLRKSGVLGAPVAAAYILAAEAHGRKFGKQDYKILDGIYAAGRIASVPVAVATGLRDGLQGAASPADGVDHRGGTRSLNEARPYEQRREWSER